MKNMVPSSQYYPHDRKYFHKPLKQNYPNNRNQTLANSIKPTDASAVLMSPHFHQKCKTINKSHRFYDSRHPADKIKQLYLEAKNYHLQALKQEKLKYRKFMKNVKKIIAEIEEQDKAYIEGEIKSIQKEYESVLEKLERDRELDLSDKLEEGLLKQYSIIKLEDFELLLPTLSTLSQQLQKLSIRPNHPYQQSPSKQDLTQSSKQDLTQLSETQSLTVDSSLRIQNNCKEQYNFILKDIPIDDNFLSCDEDIDELSSDNRKTKKSKYEIEAENVIEEAEDESQSRRESILSQ